MLFTDISAERAIKAFGKFGFIVVSKGKHVGMSDGTYRLVIPNHKRLNPYTLKAIIKDAGITDNDFKMAL
ncbi:type II toxin-antitoxin system HicA family toxin [Candidatus Magnetominusculus dajiuhuensis]|uniref:type II toxin-antitoxin system HicA family toxin n=1 Tax=Candidatus Magnetominusculus dajiuhuensis TaxID=3137712 RepID=UPI003B429937